MLAKSRTIDIGGSTFTKDVMTKAVDGWTREHLHAELRRIAIDITDHQVKQGNTPSTITVDNSSYKSIESAERKVVILFGVALARAVIQAVEQALMATIGQSTDRVTGRLADISNWSWTLVPGDGRAREVNPMDIQSMGINDRLILRPKLPYATAANQNVAGGRRGISLKTSKRASAKKVRANTRKGFLGAAAELIRRNSTVRQSFSVYAGFTRRFLAPDEVATAGKGGPLQTGQIVLRPKRRGRL